MASIKKINTKSGILTYQIIVSLGYTETGKKITKKYTYKPTSHSPKAVEKEVREFAYEYEKKVKNGRFLDGDSLTYSDVYKRWKDGEASQQLTIGQQEQYENEIEHRIIPAIGHLKMNLITPVHCQSIIDQMVNDGYSPMTIRKTKTAMNAVFVYAYRLEIIKENPVTRVKLPPTKVDKSIHFFDLEQAQTFLHALTLKYPHTVSQHTSHNGKTKLPQEVNSYIEYNSVPYQLQVFFTLAIYSGCRRGELIALTWDDVDFDNNVIRITKATGSSKKSGQYIKVPKTLNGVRDITLPKKCFDELKEWHSQEYSLSVKLGSAWKGRQGNIFDKSFIFIQDDGTQMSLSTPTHVFKKIIKEYNQMIEQEASTKDGKDKEYILSKKLPPIHLHDLRHTSATLLISEGVDVETITRRLGHSNPSITLRVYGHALESKDRAASDKLEQILGE